MKNILSKLSLIILIITTISLIKLSAQDSAAPKKEVVIIGDFTATNEVPKSDLKTIRNNVVAGFVGKGRFTVIDSEVESSLKNLNSKKGEEAVNVSNVMDETHSAAYKSLGAKYLILGDATQYTCTRTTDSEGKVTYSTKIYLSLKGFNIFTGETLAASQFELSGFGYTQPEADADANKNAKYKMNSYIDKNFAFLTKILQLDEVKKDKARSLYINCGSEVGINEGDTFTVFQVINIAGIKSKKEIGKLRASEIAGAHVTKCKVTKGGEEILVEFNKGTELIIENLGRSLFKSASAYLTN